jgi:hypothetical protein
VEKLIVVASGLTATLAYTTGYVYLDAFYEYFNISVGELEFGPQDVISFSLPVYESIGQNSIDFLLDGIVGLITVVGAGLACGLIVRYWLKRTDKADPATWWWWAGLACVGLLVWCVFQAPGAGRERAEIEVKRLRTAVIVDPQDVTGIARIKKADPNAAVLHLVSTKSTSFILIREYNRKHRRWIIRIPKSDNVFVRVFQQY